MYEYHASVVKVVDADTIDVFIDLGFDIHVNQRVRLIGINTAEKNTPLGVETAGFVRNLIPVGTKITLQSEKDKREKFGRYLARVILNDGVCLNDLLIEKKYALEYWGIGKKEDFDPSNIKREDYNGTT